MEVAKITKLSKDLNKEGIKHIVFTLDNVSMKTFGDSTTLRLLKGRPEIEVEVEQILKNSKKSGDDEVSTASNVRLHAEANSQWKGSAKIRSQCTQFLQLFGFGLKDRKLKYGEGAPPPGWPAPLDWSAFRGPGKHSTDYCKQVILGLKQEVDQDQEELEEEEQVEEHHAVEDQVVGGDEVEDLMQQLDDEVGDAIEQDQGVGSEEEEDLIQQLENEVGDAMEQDGSGSEEEEDLILQLDDTVGDDIDHHEEELLLEEGELLVDNDAMPKLPSLKKKPKIAAKPRSPGKRKIFRPSKFKDYEDDEGDDDEEARPSKRAKSITSQVKTQMERFQHENETIPILIQQRKNKQGLLDEFGKIFPSAKKND